MKEIKRPLCGLIWYRSNEFARTDHKHKCILVQDHIAMCLCECKQLRDFFEVTPEYLSHMT